MKAVIYSRVSTEEQNTRNQVDVLKAWDLIFQKSVKNKLARLLKKTGQLGMEL